MDAQDVEQSVLHLAYIMSTSPDISNKDQSEIEATKKNWITNANNQHRHLYENISGTLEKSCRELKGAFINAILEHDLEDTFQKAEIKDSISALNNAFFTDGVYINVPENIKLEKPLYCLFIAISTQCSHGLRNIIELSEQADCEMIFHHYSEKGIDYFSHQQTQLRLLNKAKLNMLSLHEVADGHHIERILSEQAEDSELNFSSISVICYD